MFWDINDRIKLGGGGFAIILAVAGAVSACSRLTAGEVTCWADDTVAVDASASFKLVSGSIDIKYDTDWCTVTNVAGAVPVIKAVSAPDTENAVTTAVAIADFASPVAYEGSGYMRFILCAELNGEKVGETLVSDISFGAKSAFSAALAFDGRTNALQEAVNTKAPATLRYDLKWADVATEAEISLIRVRREKNGAFIDAVTNTLHSVDAPDAGDLTFATATLQWGDYNLLLREYAADGTLLLETLSPEFSIEHVFGTAIIIR